MRTLTDVYIKVTKQNIKQLHSMVFYVLEIGNIISFDYDDDESFSLRKDVIEYKQKVSLNQLKRLIDTIPTREEITRLKQQISAYKTNYERAVKHSLSKEDVIEELTAHSKWLKYKLEESNKRHYNALKELEQLKKRKWWQIWK